MNIPWWLTIALVILAWLGVWALFTHAVREFFPLVQEPKGANWGQEHAEGDEMPRQK